ncbi:MAG: hypothetical protein QOD77_35 [Thermoplasmata archaeon]|jgi:GT2 family glycosyltransferase|nr:hypothetical protein [Thermoplasmata archaeon]
MPVAGPAPKVSILIATYDGARFIPDLAASLARQEGPAFEVVVVDNASRDGTADEVARLMPTARVIRSDRNLGFCGGNNLAARNAAGELLVLLNQDTEVRPGWLAHLVAAVEADLTVGVAQSKVLLHRDPTILNSVGCGFNYLFFGWADRNGQKDDVEGPPFEVPYCQGASLIIRRALYEELGGFDEPFFMYHDDLELGLKARLAGKRCVCVPDSVVLHKYNEASPPQKLYLLERNRHLMMWKYYGRWTRFLLWPLNALMDGGIFLLAIPQQWWREKLRAHRDARRMLKAARGPSPHHPYTDAQLVRLLGCRFEAGAVAPSFNQKVARFLMRAYYPIVKALA